MSGLRGFILEFRSQGQPRTFESEQDRVIIGRSPTCDCVVQEERVSRQHAKIIREGDSWALVDMGSANGTFINDRPVVKETLRHGDRITLGEIDLNYRSKAQQHTQLHQVILDSNPAPKNKTAILNLADLGSISSIGEARRQDTSGFNLAINLFTQAAQALLGGGVLEEVLAKVMDLVFRNLPVERGIIALYDEARGIQPRVTKVREGLRADNVRLSQTIALEAIRKQQAVLVRDMLSDEKFSGEESVLAMNIAAAMCTPMYNEGRVSGIIYVDSQNSRSPFTEDQLRMLSTFGLVAAVAVEQTRLRDRVVEEERVRERLERYSSRAVVDRIVKGALTTSEHPTLDWMADERVVTVLFADLSGFTTLSESLAPTEVALLLNAIFSRLTQAIFDFEGTLDKFMGDGMMAFFGAPEDQPDHALRAVRAAQQMQKALAEFNAQRGDGRTVRMRVGINTGKVVAGDIGSPKRRDYTVIGDTVNIASRLESSVAEPGQVVIGPLTCSAVKQHFQCKSLGTRQLKGRGQGVEAFLVERET